MTNRHEVQSHKHQRVPLYVRYWFLRAKRTQQKKQTTTNILMLREGYKQG